MKIHLKNDRKRCTGLWWQAQLKGINKNQPALGILQLGGNGRGNLLGFERMWGHNPILWHDDWNDK